MWISQQLAFTTASMNVLRNFSTFNFDLKFFCIALSDYQKSTANTEFLNLTWTVICASCASSFQEDGRYHRY